MTASRIFICAGTDANPLEAALGNRADWHFSIEDAEKELQTLSGDVTLYRLDVQTIPLISRTDQ